MRFKCRAVWVVVALLGLLTISAFAQTLPTGVQKQSSLGGITEYLFPNGLRVLLYPDPSAPKITVNATYLVGSRHEGYGETGMAHLLEHMNFIKTTNGREIKKEIVNHGASWNGSTSYDRTNYFETFTASDENLKWALGLEADRMVNVRMEKELLDTEMTVVRNEFERGENSPQRVLEERVVATAYLWHNYGKSTIGSREDIEKVPIDRLAAFYEKYYQPDNVVVVIAGQIDPAKTLGFVSETLGKIPRPARMLDQTYTVEPAQDGERSVELRRVGNGQELMLAYHGPAAGHPDSVALQVLAGVMNGSGGGFGGDGAGSGRLGKALVETKKALRANMGFQELHDPGFVLFSASLNQDQSLDDVRKTLSQTIGGIVADPPTAAEVNRAKTRLLRSLEQRMTDAQQLGLSLSTPIAQGDWRLIFLQHDRLQEVKPEDLVRVAKLYFKDSNLTVGTFVPEARPERTVVPTAPSFATLFADYHTTVAVRQGEAFDPTPTNIEGRVVRTKLANGLKVVLLPKQTTAGTVSASIQLHFGNAKVLAGKGATAQMAGSLLMFGTKTKTRQQIQEEMEKLNARIFVTGGGGGGGGGRGGRGGFGPGIGGSLSDATATIETKAENLIPAMQLAVEMLREPAYPESEFERIKSQRVKALSEPRTDPGQLATQTLQIHLSPFAKGDALYGGTPAEQAEALSKVTLDDVKKFHDQFYGSSHGELVVVGQFDRAAVEKAATELLGRWNSPAPYQRLVSSYKKTEAVNQKIETPDKENAQFEAGLRIQMSEDDPDYPAMVLANYMFGGSITARMPNRIRNNEGLSYSVSSRFMAPVVGDAALFSASAISNPRNTPKVEGSFIDELKKALQNGFTAEEVATAKKAFHDQQTVARSSDAALMRLLASREEAGRTLKWDEQLESKIESLTPDQISSAFRSHVDSAAMSIVKAGDFQRAGAY
ncbi:MAG: pitrilysin family protein [Acidobacteriia bacterium]|nr:pitrilysin family protein [Terriglobia bacterium]